MAQKVPKMPENGQNSCTKEKNGRNNRSIQGVKNTKLSKLLCSSENLMFNFKFKSLGFKKDISFMLRIGNLQNFDVAQSDVMVSFLFHFSCFTILFIWNLHYVKVLQVTFTAAFTIQPNKIAEKQEKS